MIRAAIDSTILVYAELEPESEKGKAAHAILEAFAPQGILAVQTLLEFVAVVRRKRPESLESAFAKTRAWSTVFDVAPTTQNGLAGALEMVRSHQVQVWDAVVWTAVREAGARIFFSEALQDGFSMGGLAVVDPFAPANAARIEALLEP